MKHRVKSATSIALAAAMLATSVFSGGGAVFAESEDLVQMETAVEEKGVVADSTLAPELAVTDDGISVSDVSDTIEIETVEAQTGAAVSIQKEDISVDNSRLLAVSAFNKSDADCKFRLYFWDGELPEEKENWNFSNPNMDVFLVSDSEKLTGKLTHQGIDQDVDLRFVEDRTGDAVKARYLLADLPADSSLDFTVRVDANAACDVSAITSVDDALFEGVSLSWATEDIVIESGTEAEMILIEPETNDIVIEDSIVIEGGETETETGLAGENGISVESGIHAAESETGDSVEMETDAVPSETEAFVDENIETETAAVHTDSISFEEAIAETETAANGVQEIETGEMANGVPEAEIDSTTEDVQDAAEGATADEPDPDGTGIVSETDETGENAFAADATEEEISETVSDRESEFEDETEVVAPEEVETGEEDPEPVTEVETGFETETETEEHFLETADGIGELDVSDFASMRLVVLASDVNTIIDPEHVIANYDTIYLMQYDSAEQAMNAYVYYLANADAAEPDMILEAAEESAEEEVVEINAPIPGEATEIEVTEEQNPIAALSEEDDSAVAQNADRVIALIDTGASESANVIDRVSLIDDVLTGTHGHADEMVAAIVGQNPDAKILSIRAMGDDGRGTVSSIVAAMEYAINQNVSIINLSLYAKTSLLNSVLESEIQKAVEAGIDVVGAAGNAGEDAVGYMPGSVDAAWIIGACDENGARLKSSNYGDTVDYYVAAGSTSEAAAKFSGYISLYGFSNVTEFALTGTEVTEPSDIDLDVTAPEVTKEDSDNAILDSVVESYVMENADAAYTNVDKIELRAVLAIKNTFVDADMVEDGMTLDDIMHDDDALAAFITQVPAITAVYNLSDDSDYYVSFADTMHYDSTTEIMETAMAYNNLWGEDFSDYIYDGTTGLVYIPKYHYTQDGNPVLDSVQMQFLRKTYLDDSDDFFVVASAVTSVVDDDENVMTDVTSENAFAYTTNITVEKDLDLDTLTVALNGIPLPSGYYSYDPVSGNLGLMVSSAAIQNISVYCEGRDYDQDIAAAGVTYAKMTAVNNPAHPAQVDLNVLKNKTVYRGTVDVWFHANGYNPDGVDMGLPIYFADTSDEGWQDRATDILLYTSGYVNSISGTTGNGNVTQYDTNTGKWTIDISSISLKKDADKNAITDPVQWDDLSYKSNGRLNIRSFCVHVKDNMDSDDFKDWRTDFSDIWDKDNGIEDTSQGKAKWTTTNCILRPLYVHESTGAKDDSYVVFSIVTRRSGDSNQQNGMGLFKIIVKDVPQTSRIQIKKVNGDKDWSDDLKGAEFTLYDGTKKLKTVTIKNADYHEFDYDCKVDHTYTIKETKTPDGYVTAEDIPVEVGSGSSYKKTYQYTIKNHSVPEVYVKKKSTASADVLALSAYSIKDAEFGIYTDQACTNKLGKVKTGTDGESGTFKLPCQKDGTYTYWVREDKAPAGHKRNTTPKKVTIKLPADADKTIPVEISDDPLFSHISIKKVDGRGNWNDSLKGAQFSLYHGNSKLETITINSGDYYTFEYDCRLGESYVVKETRTPDEKIPAEDIPVKIETSTSYKETYQYTVWNIEPPKVQVTKESTAGAEILGLKSYSVEGAEFGIYTDQACTNKIGTLNTKADGTTDPFRLPCESNGTYTYWVREDKAPAGHKQNTTPKAFSVTLPNDDGRTIPVEISDDPEFCEHEFNVIKLDDKGQPVPNAIFKVEYFDAQLADPAKLVKTWYLRSDERGEVLIDRLHLDPSRRSQSSDFFTWIDANNVTKIVIPVGGYLRLTEVEAPAEYILDDTPMGFLTTKTVELERKCVNTLEPCELRLKKYDTNGTTPLAGVEFKLSFVSESEEYTADARPTYTRLLKVGESTTVKTNSKGEITFSNLDQGTYQITEVSTVSGHTLLKDPIVVTLPIKLSQSEIAAYGNVDTSKGKVDPVTGKTFFYSCLYEITNTPTFSVPMTGSTGTWRYGFIGIAIIAGIGAGVGIYTGRRRKRKIRKA